MALPAAATSSNAKGMWPSIIATRARKPDAINALPAAKPSMPSIKL